MTGARLVAQHLRANLVLSFIWSRARVRAEDETQVANESGMKEIGQIILIRHGEKSPGNNNLNALGTARAISLVPYFQSPSKPFNTPQVIFAMKQNKIDSSNRPKETVEPLAESLQLKVQTPYTREDTSKLVWDIIDDSDKYAGKTLLICWEHKWLLAMANKLGVPVKVWSKTPFNAASQDDDFNSVGVITPSKTGVEFEAYLEPDVPPLGAGATNGAAAAGAPVAGPMPLHPACVHPSTKTSFTWKDSRHTAKKAFDLGQSGWKEELEGGKR